MTILCANGCGHEFKRGVIASELQDGMENKLAEYFSEKSGSEIIQHFFSCSKTEGVLRLRDIEAAVKEEVSKRAYSQLTRSFD